MACVRSTPAFQPEIVPSSVLTMKRAGPEAAPLETTKPLVLLKTTPVGAATVPAGLPLGGGIVTTIGVPGGGGKGAPAPLYSVLRPVPLSAIQKGVVGPCTMPQELTRLGSCPAASPGISEKRFVFW